MVWYGMVWCGVVWCGVVWCGVVWCGVVWCGVVWYAFLFDLPFFLIYLPFPLSYSFLLSPISSGPHVASTCSAALLWSSCSWLISLRRSLLLSPCFLSPSPCRSPCGMHMLCCSADGTVAAFLFDQSELGIPLTHREMDGRIASLYGHRHVAASHSLVEDPELLALQQQVEREEAAAAAAAATTAAAAAVFGNPKVRGGGLAVGAAAVEMTAITPVAITPAAPAAAAAAAAPAPAIATAAAAVTAAVAAGAEAVIVLAVAAAPATVAAGVTAATGPAAAPAVAPLKATPPAITAATPPATAPAAAPTLAAVLPAAARAAPATVTMPAAAPTAPAAVARKEARPPQQQQQGGNQLICNQQDRETKRQKLGERLGVEGADGGGLNVGWRLGDGIGPGRNGLDRPGLGGREEESARSATEGWASGLVVRVEGRGGYGVGGSGWGGGDGGGGREGGRGGEGGGEEEGEGKVERVVYGSVIADAMALQRATAGGGGGAAAAGGSGGAASAAATDRLLGARDRLWNGESRVVLEARMRTDTDTSPSDLLCSLNGHVLWRDRLPSPVTAIAGCPHSTTASSHHASTLSSSPGASLWAVACANHSLRIFSSAGRRLLPEILLDSPAVLLSWSAAEPEPPSPFGAEPPSRFGAEPPSWSGAEPKNQAWFGVSRNQRLVFKSPLEQLWDRQGEMGIGTWGGRGEEGSGGRGGRGEGGSGGRGGRGEGGSGGRGGRGDGGMVGPMLLVVTRGGGVRVWDMGRLQLLVDADMGALGAEASGGTLRMASARLLPPCTPLITLLSGKCFLLHPSLHAWMPLSRPHPSSRLSSNWRPPPGAFQAGGFRSAGWDGAGAAGASSFLSRQAPGEEAHATRAHLENALAACRLLNSPDEFRRLLAEYVRLLTKEGDEGRLREVCQELLGSVDAGEHAVTTGAGMVTDNQAGTAVRHNAQVDE
ncbi:unnamed protein product, partial [Closterium sp. NIES-53]